MKKNKSITFRLEKTLYNFIETRARENFTTTSRIIHDFIVEKFNEEIKNDNIQNKSSK